MSNAIRLLDLFSGAGGLSRGFHDASDRFESVAAVEFDPTAAASYSHNFPYAEVHAKDITEWLDGGGAVAGMATVIIGGPPCQGFSTLGKQEVDDERNELWRQYERTILAVQPDYFVVENVAAFSKSPQFAQFRESVDGGHLQDYDFHARVLNAADFGTPQARKRAILIGFRRDLGFPGWPEPTHAGAPVSVRHALRHVPEHVVGVEFPDARTTDFQGRTFKGAFRSHELHLGRNYSDQSMRRFKAIPRGGNRFDLPDELKAPCWIAHKSGSGDVMGRLHLDRPSVTIRTEFFKPEKGRYIHPTADRALTHWEAAKLQGFPDDHLFVGSKTQIARQIGNAVPIPLGRAIGQQIAAAIR